MLNYHLKDLAEICNGEMFGLDSLIQQITIDSRQVPKHSLFIPIKGRNFDGHTFIENALEKGAMAFFTENNESNDLCKRPHIRVNNTKEALGKIAAHHRQTYKNPVISLTGSFGKTTTKAMIANILRCRHSVLAPSASMNNDIGVPLTLLQLAEQDYAVIEVGTNHFGEIPYLANLVKPDIALITKIGAVHLEALKSLAGVAQEKSALYSALRPDGCAIVNMDDPFSKDFIDIINPRKIVTFACDVPADVSAEKIKLDHEGKASFVLNIRGKRQAIQLPTLGEHNVNNALAAAAVATVCNISISDIKQGLEMLPNIENRLILKKGLFGSKILDDSYSATPEAVTAALKVLAKQQGKKIFIFGGMAELNPDKVINIHQAVAHQAEKLGIDHLYAIGDLSKHTVAAFKGGKHFTCKNQLIDEIKAILQDNVTVLIKGSRGMRLEEVVAQLIEMPPLQK